MDQRQTPTVVEAQIGHPSPDPEVSDVDPIKRGCLFWCGLLPSPICQSLITTGASERDAEELLLF